MKRFAYIFSNVTRMIDSKDSLADKHRPLLVGKCLLVIAHDVVESCKELVTRSNLWMDWSVYIVEQVESFTDQLVAITQESLLDLGLTTSEEVVGIRCL